MIEPSTESRSGARGRFLDRHPDLFCCPGCGGRLATGEASVLCQACGHRFPITAEIPQLFWPNEWDPTKDDVTERMKSFYEANPFPNYDDFDSAGTLLDKARRGLFAKLLDDQIPFGARVIECGCGTGQLTNFLSIANRTVIGVDLCMSSLRMALDFKQQNGLERAHFYQMNLFRPSFKPESFDLVISNGVLHHTSDPFLGFQSIARLVRPGGFILVGLYHRYGRLATDLRRALFRLSHDRFLFLDRHASDQNVSREKRRSWFMDQYKNPHESKHTVGEVVTWLYRTGFEFVNSVPKTMPLSPIDESERLFKPQRLGSGLERLAVNLGMIVTGHREGGFFIVIARKPAAKT
ncbi:MAG: class I SAM-dependent methyltransferase [Acidobacteria bacterium]|nr:class I SAM-dependent methyltransferase [Acidobacteriota bacterium]